MAKQSKKSAAVTADTATTSTATSVAAPVSEIDFSDIHFNNLSDKICSRIQEGKKVFFVMEKNVIAHNPASGDYVIEEELTQQFIDYKRTGIVPTPVVPVVPVATIVPPVEPVKETTENIGTEDGNEDEEEEEE